MGWWWLLAGCAARAPEPAPLGPVPEVVTAQTRDGVALVADLWPGQPGAPGVVLLHMTPRGPFTRKDWPGALTGALHGRGWHVVAIDRRGAGDSGGRAADAFSGPAGRLDVEAAVGLARGRGAGPIAIVGASNGTTSMIDYAAWAPSEGLPEPVALGFLSGGDYTERQTAMAELPRVPAFFGYPTAERAWSEAQRPLDPGSWTFYEWPGDAHGTLAFGPHPELVDQLAGWLDGALASP